MPGREDSFEIADRALSLLKRLCSKADPHAFELCFIHESGLDAALVGEVSRALAADIRLSEEQVERLYDLFISVDHKLFVEAERGVTDLTAQIDTIVDTISAAQSSATRFEAQLSALADVVRGPAHPVDMARVIAGLQAATREISSANKLFGQHVRTSLSEVDRLRVSFALARRETLVDPLTGIANRRHFETSLALAAEAAHATGHPLSLIVADIDHFKHFNDNYGHATGDQVLRLVSATMRDQVGPSALLARFGGEEFAIVLPDHDLEAARSIAEAIRTSVMRRDLLKRSTGEVLGRVTISLGIAALDGRDTPASLLDRADHCMYQAKRHGRNRVEVSCDPLPRLVPDAA